MSPNLIFLKLHSAKDSAVVQNIPHFSEPHFCETNPHFIVPRLNKVEEEGYWISFCPFERNFHKGHVQVSNGQKWPQNLDLALLLV